MQSITSRPLVSGAMPVCPWLRAAPAALLCSALICRKTSPILQKNTARADAQEFLLDAVDSGDLSLKADGKHVNLPDLKLIYHAPCHLRAQGNGLPGLELLRAASTA